MNQSSLIQETIYAGIMKISNCCSSVFELLPNPELPFLPSLVIGLLISSIILIYLVQKDTKKSFSEVVPMFFRQLFLSFPVDGNELDKVNQVELLDKVTLRWQNQKFLQCSDRLRHAIGLYINNNGSQSDKDEAISDNSKKCILLHIESLPSIPWWTDYEAFNKEKKKLLSNSAKIKEEFLKVFGDFRKGICKQWCKVELMKGHSCSYPLIHRGVINTANSSSCPTTFKALVDCGVLGLSGCVFGSASFTLLFPDSTVKQASSYSNTSIKCDLVLQTGGTKALLEVAGHQEEYREGAVMFYDPSSPHCSSLPGSKNMTLQATPVAVLSLDLWHPGLEVSEKQLLAKLFAA